MKSITAQHLVKTYRNGQVRALDDLTLDVEEGTVLSVLGPNGAGKSTTISMLVGLVPPSGGEAYMSGLCITQDMQKIRQNLGVCPQVRLILYNNSRSWMGGWSLSPLF